MQKVYLLQYKKCPIKFFKQVLDGRKSALANMALIPVCMTRYKEFSVKRALEMVEDDVEIMQYLPTRRYRPGRSTASLFSLSSTH